MNNIPLMENLYRAFKVMQNRFYNLAESYNVTPAQLGALEKLWLEDELTVSELGEKLRLKTSTVTALADRMERDSLIRRERSEDDRRVVRLYLTDKGKSLKGKIPNFNQYILAEIQGGMTGDEISTFNKLLNKFIQILETKNVAK